ncbi:MGDG synthase family glycosyltransferase [Oceanobacillus timonensis]|uniref:MGDG synthase family glycosyltransferase n=1 Tax=Oceanobacillus timonensis TaxID=1926285 RepID=UPI0009BAA9B4
MRSLILNKIKNLIKQTKPDIIICTHALPSYLLNQLKKENIWTGPVINVYTDYFINDLWGIEHINYHFVPSLHFKQELVMRGIKPKQIFVTGIPIDSILKKKKISGNNEN